DALRSSCPAHGVRERNVIELLGGLEVVLVCDLVAGVHGLHLVELGVPVVCDDGFGVGERCLAFRIYNRDICTSKGIFTPEIIWIHIGLPIKPTWVALCTKWRIIT